MQLVWSGEVYAGLHVLAVLVDLFRNQAGNTFEIRLKYASFRMGMAMRVHACTSLVR